MHDQSEPQAGVQLREGVEEALVGVGVLLGVWWRGLGLVWVLGLVGLAGDATTYAYTPTRVLPHHPRPYARTYLDPRGQEGGEVDVVDNGEEAEEQLRGAEDREKDGERLGVGVGFVGCVV